MEARLASVQGSRTRHITSLPVELAGRGLGLLGLKALVDCLDKLGQSEP